MLITRIFYQWFHHGIVFPVALTKGWDKGVTSNVNSFISYCRPKAGGWGIENFVMFKTGDDPALDDIHTVKELRKNKVVYTVAAGRFGNSRQTNFAVGTSYYCNRA